MKTEKTTYGNTTLEANAGEYFVMFAGCVIGRIFKSEGDVWLEDAFGLANPRICLTINSAHDAIECLFMREDLKTGCFFTRKIGKHGKIVDLVRSGTSFSSSNPVWMQR